jgi:hypothetical protein
MDEVMEEEAVTIGAWQMDALLKVVAHVPMPLAPA